MVELLSFVKFIIKTKVQIDMWIAIVICQIYYQKKVQIDMWI